MISFKDCFRLIFVIFSLYLVGDAFYRWDGFRYYASFAEFLPSFALVFIMWSMLAGAITLMAWLPARAAAWLCNRAGFKITSGHLSLQVALFIIIGGLVWKIKRIFWPSQIHLLLKLTLFIFAVGTSIMASRLLYQKVQKWTNIIQERITPLVWGFGILAVLSLPLVFYNALLKSPDKSSSLKMPASAVSKSDRPNIILITFDALTARDMSVYGYKRETTPFISAWAQKASVFTRVEAASNFTTPATASLMTGKRVWTHQTYHLSGSRPIRSTTESLPAILGSNGYFNMAFIANQYASVKTLGIDGSFDMAPLMTEFVVPHNIQDGNFGIIDVFLYKLFGDKIRFHDWIFHNDFILGKYLNRYLHRIIPKDNSTLTRPPYKVFDSFLNTYKKGIRVPFFAWLHILPPHRPYNSPDTYNGIYKDSADNISDEDQKGLRVRYDELIRYCDKQLEEFIAALEKEGDFRNTIVIISSDHGESFEHGYKEHGGLHLYEQVTHIPLIIREPGQTDGKIVDVLMEQIDIPPTILDLVSISVPAWMEGRSFAPFLRSEGHVRRPIFSMVFSKNPSLGHEIQKGTIAAWEDNYKLIHYLEKKESFLFNLVKDPNELNNLIDTEPETKKRLLYLIADNLKNANEKIRAEALSE